MGEKGLADFFEDLVIMSRYEIFIEPHSMGYLVTVTDDSGAEVASDIDDVIYLAIKRCWRSLCG